MKKTLSVLAVLGIFAFTAQSAHAAWADTYWNPANWFGRSCNKCEKKCDPCSTGYAAPCDPCQKKVIQQPSPCQKSNPCPEQKTCDPCDKLQNMNK